MIEYLVLASAILIAYIAAAYTNDERTIYLKKHYFPFMLPALFILSIIFYFSSRTTSFTLAFMTILIAVWMKRQ